MMLKNRIQILDKISAQYLKGVGPRVAELLQKCHIKTVQDILFHLPYRYQDRTRLTPIREAVPENWIVIEGRITEIQTNRQFICKLQDQTGYIKLLFFHISAMQKSRFTIGARVRCYGEVRLSTQGLTIIHPEVQLITPNTAPNLEETFTPIYPSTEGLSQSVWRKLTQAALNLMNTESLPDYLDGELSLHQALQIIHRPPLDADIDLLTQRQHPAQKRLAFEELLAHHLSLRVRREKTQQITAPQFVIDQKKHQQFLNALPFQLTLAQTRVVKEIFEDIAKPHPMQRLVQGDVGSGKTVIAALTALQAAHHGYQTAFMAPTELLAEQHYQHFTRWFTPLDIPVLNLTGKLTAKQKAEAAQQLENHAPLIAIGTHALFQENITFKKLGLVMIDEQHRFGVAQRLALTQKGQAVHQLVMTATPIPRTLAMTFYADLNVSMIDELPKNRLPIKTVVMPESRRSEIIQRIQQAHQQRRQIYWVCPLIEASETLQQQAAETTLIMLKQALPELGIGLIHGKLKPLEKENIMRLFKAHKIDLLVATTVIEVGVDVPNASIMVIENAERLGLAQLHQLRGRVGRGSVESCCILLYQPPLSMIAKTRLQTLRELQDGFKIAEKDLTLRGPGELLGTRQTGELNFRIAHLEQDQALFAGVQQTAEVLLSNYPERVELILNRWVSNELLAV